MSTTDMQMKLQWLAEELTITEERREQLELDRRRLVVSHSLVLHRDKTSADDLKAMIRHLEAAGMPSVATLKIDGQGNHTRMYATWSTDPDGGGEAAEIADDDWEGILPSAAEVRRSEREAAIARALTFSIGDEVVRVGDPKRVKTRGKIQAFDAGDPTRLQVRWGGRPPASWHDVAELQPTMTEAVDSHVLDDIEGA
jgi:hypothetical protein